MKVAIHRAALPLALLLATIGPDLAAKPRRLPSVAEKTRGMQVREGLFHFHVDEKRGKIWLEVPPPRGARGNVAGRVRKWGIRRFKP